MQRFQIHGRRSAIHPHWAGYLLLSEADSSVRHEGTTSIGTYRTEGQVLTVNWEKYPADIFHDMFGTLIHEQLLNNAPILKQFSIARINDKFVRCKGITLEVPNTDYVVDLRLPSSDVPTFEQIFVNGDYDSEFLPQHAEFIIDLGANIGLGAVFFALKHPDSKILAVEPDLGNFRMLVKNTSAIGERIKTLHCASWMEDGLVSLHTESENGASLEAWGVQVSDTKRQSNIQVRSATLGTLMAEAKFPHIDILKVDIEGAELEIFSHNPRSWLENVEMVIVETHDRFRPGSEYAVREAMRLDFKELTRSGENLIFLRQR